MNDEEIICNGCGVSIQSEDKTALGYAPPSALSRDIVICQRCYRLKHYGEVQSVGLSDDDYLQVLHQIGDVDALIVKIVDIFDFTGSWIEGFQRYAVGNDVLLVGNKVDVLPESTNHRRLEQWMRRMAKKQGLGVKDVALISAKTGAGIDVLADMIDDYRHGQDVYVVGSTNVGKSTFINDLIREYAGDERLLLTTSMIPGTTLNVVDFPLEDGQTLYDTPGIINRGQMAHLLDKQELKTTTPARPIKPKVYQLNAEQTLFLAGLARMDYINGDRRSFVCYVANDLYIHRTKLENADALYRDQLGDVLQPPKADNAQALPTLERHVFNLPASEGKVDIVFSGLGWMTVHGGKGRVAAYAPEGIDVFLRVSII